MWLAADDFFLGIWKMKWNWFWSNLWRKNYLFLIVFASFRPTYVHITGWGNPKTLWRLRNIIHSECRRHATTCDGDYRQLKIHVDLMAESVRREVKIKVRFISFFIGNNRFKENIRVLTIVVIFLIIVIKKLSQKYDINTSNWNFFPAINLLSSAPTMRDFGN